MTFSIVKDMSDYFIHGDFTNDLNDFDSICKVGIIGYDGHIILHDKTVKFNFTCEESPRKIKEFNDVVQGFYSNSLQNEKRQIWNQINEFRDKWQYSFFVYDGRQWDCDLSARTIITGTVTFALALGGNLPLGFIFRDHNNNNWPMSGYDMITLGSVLFKFTGDCYQVSWLHKYCVGLLSSVEEIKSYNYTLGWPNRDI